MVVSGAASARTSTRTAEAGMNGRGEWLHASDVRRRDEQASAKQCFLTALGGRGHVDTVHPEDADNPLLRPSFIVARHAAGAEHPDASARTRGGSRSSAGRLRTGGDAAREPQGARSNGTGRASVCPANLGGRG